MKNQKYIGRFAPSPTGPLHFGTLLAAVASFLQARANRGQWLVRIEDVDTARCIKRMDTLMLKTLEHFGLHWDGEVMYQTQRTHAYEEALDTLRREQLVFPCSCSRKQLAAQTGEWSPVYPGTCRLNTDWSSNDVAIRTIVPDEIISFSDRLYGSQQQNLARDVGDFVIKRRDQLFAYQLAVVVDDAQQNITEVVRGSDLLDSTARQIFLQRALGYAQPSYFHLPLVLDTDDNKLSKSSGAYPVENNNPPATIIRLLEFLGQDVSAELADASLDELWQYAITHWDPDRIPVRNRSEL